MKRLLVFSLAGLVLLAGLYLAFVLHWTYSDGERAGWVQKFSHKGWVCKTWEGELAMVSLPGSTPEKFYFSVPSEAVAARLNEAMGRRVSLHYQQRKGVPSSCWGETEYWVDEVRVVPDMNAAPAPAAPVPAPGGGQP